MTSMRADVLKLFFLYFGIRGLYDGISQSSVDGAITVSANVDATFTEGVLFLSEKYNTFFL